MTRIHDEIIARRRAQGVPEDQLRKGLDKVVLRTKGGLSIPLRNITYLDNTTAHGLAQATRGYALMFEKFGPRQSGKTTRAEEWARLLAADGKQVIVADNLKNGHQDGVRVYAK